MANIATSRGMVQAKVGDGVAVGKRVRVLDGVAKLAVVPANVYPV